MKFILFDFQISSGISLLVNIFVIAPEYDYDRGLFRLWFEEGKLIDWDFLFIRYIYKRFIKKD